MMSSVAFAATPAASNALTSASTRSLALPSVSPNQHDVGAVATWRTTPGPTSTPASIVDAPMTRSAPIHAASSSSFDTVFCIDSATATRSRRPSASANERAVSLALTRRIM